MLSRFWSKPLGAGGKGPGVWAESGAARKKAKDTLPLTSTSSHRLIANPPKRDQNAFFGSRSFLSRIHASRCRDRAPTSGVMRLPPKARPPEAGAVAEPRG